MALLALASSCALAGRKPVGEFALAHAVPQDPPEAFSNALYQTVGVSLSPGHAVQWANNGKAHEAIAALIEKAESSIHVVTFIWSEGKSSEQLMKALNAAVNRGCACRVILDSVGSASFDERPLRAAGCEVRRFRPLPGQDDLARNHRKLVIVDGKAGVIGGFGIDDKWRGRGKKEEEWRDSNMVARGPAVLQMQQAFAENWQEAGGSLLPLAAFPLPEKVGGAWAAFVGSTEHSVVTISDRLIQFLIAAAKKRVWIANAYFVPSEPVLELLAKKAAAGVDVRILTAGEKTDTRVYLPIQRERVARLLEQGAQGFEYDPAMMHSKTMLVDTEILTVGSANLDALSLNKMEEGNLVVRDAEAAAQLEKDLLDDFRHSKPMKLRK